MIDARLRRTKCMLAGTDHSFADIAYACGFSSQAHMTTAFRKNLGTTPGAYRRDIKS